MIKRYTGQQVSFSVNGTLGAGQTLEAKNERYNSNDGTACTVSAVSGGWVITVPNGDALPVGRYDLILIVKAGGSIIADTKFTYQIVAV